MRERMTHTGDIRTGFETYEQWYMRARLSDHRTALENPPIFCKVGNREASIVMVDAGRPGARRLAQWLKDSLPGKRRRVP